MCLLNPTQSIKCISEPFPVPRWSFCLQIHWNGWCDQWLRRLCCCRPHCSGRLYCSGQLHCCYSMTHSLSTETYALRHSSSVSPSPSHHINQTQCLPCCHPRRKSLSLYKVLVLGPKSLKIVENSAFSNSPLGIT